MIDVSTYGRKTTRVDVDSDEDGTSFWQYPDLLLDYDDHAPLREGMEGAPVYIHDESGAHVPCGMDDEDGNVDGKDATPLEAATRLAASLR